MAVKQVALKAMGILHSFELLTLLLYYIFSFLASVVSPDSDCQVSPENLFWVLGKKTPIVDIFFQVKIFLSISTGAGVCEQAHMAFYQT